MAITITVGTNSYASVAEADAYFTQFGNEDWTSITDEDQKAQALILATQSVDLLYGKKFASLMNSDSQSLLFPRVPFVDKDGRTISGIPSSLKNAVAEVALMQINGQDIFPEESETNNIKKSQVTVGGITLIGEKYAPGDSAAYDGFSKVEMILRPLFKSTSANWRIKA